MIGGWLLLSYVTLQRGVELIIAQRNTRALLARGAYEVGAGHYPAMIALHATWLASLWVFGWDRPLVLGFVALFIVLQCGRFWVLATLGPRWTTRIIMTPWAGPVTSGPFRFVRHPNYLVVALELPCLSLALGLRWHAMLFGVLNLLMIWWRIRSENRLLRLAFHRELVARWSPSLTMVALVRPAHHDTWLFSSAC